MYGTEGPAVFVYRGEALRLAGDPEAARVDLARALEISEERLGAWLNLALVALDLDDRSSLEAAWIHLKERASGLLSDAAADVGVVVWGDPGESPTPAEQRRVLERALALTGGNRSTGLTTYITAAGRLRLVPSGARPQERAINERSWLRQAGHHLRPPRR